MSSLVALRRSLHGFIFNLKEQLLRIRQLSTPLLHLNLKSLQAIRWWELQHPLWGREAVSSHHWLLSSPPYWYSRCGRAKGGLWSAGRAATGLSPDNPRKWNWPTKGGQPVRLHHYLLQGYQHCKVLPIGCSRKWGRREQGYNTTVSHLTSAPDYDVSFSCSPTWHWHKYMYHGPVPEGEPWMSCCVT